MTESPAGEKQRLISENLIVLYNIRVQFDSVIALHDANLAVGRGEVVGLLGENGAGKTTLINVLNGIVPVQSGEIYIRGWRVEDAERWVGAVVSAAYHDALLAGLAALGIERVEGVRDGRICDACPAAAGGSWHPGDDPPGGTRRPPATVDCHCTVVPAGG